MFTSDVLIGAEVRYRGERLHAAQPPARRWTRGRPRAGR